MATTFGTRFLLTLTGSTRFWTKLPTQSDVLQNHLQATLLMAVGVSGEVVVNLVVLDVKQEHAQIPNQQGEVLDVLDFQAKFVTQKNVQLSGSRPVPKIVGINAEVGEVCAKKNVVLTVTAVIEEPATVQRKLEMQAPSTTLV